MKPCRFTFDDTPAFDGFAHGSKWNGFDNVAVTKETLADIVQYFWVTGDNETAEQLMEITPTENGMISLGWGYATQIVEPNHD